MKQDAWFLRVGEWFPPRVGAHDPGQCRLLLSAAIRHACVYGALYLRLSHLPTMATHGYFIYPIAHSPWACVTIPCV